MMIRKIFFGVLLFFVALTQGWGAKNNSVNYSCKYSDKEDIPVSINQLYNPQGNSADGYIELYIRNGAVNLTGWKLCYATGNNTNECIDLGQNKGDVYYNGSKVGTDGAQPVAEGSFVVYDEVDFDSKKVFGESNGEMILITPDNKAAHYTIYYNNNPSPEYSTGSECKTVYPNSSASDNGICATPDGMINTNTSGDTDDWDRNCGNTKGTYNSDPIPPAAEWRMDECVWNGTNSEIKDSIGSRHGTSKGLNSDGRVAATSDGGILNRSGEFKGEGYNADPNNAWYQARYYTEIADHSSLSPLSVTQSAGMTITGWFRLNNASGTHTILHKGGTDTSQEYRVFIEDGKLRFTVWDTWGSPKTIIVNQNLVANQYYFFAVTANIDLGYLPLILDTLNLNAYVKTESVTYSQSGSFSLYTYNAFKNGKLYFGATKWNSTITNFLNGNIDEIKLYGSKLSLQEINRIFINENNGKDYGGNVRADVTCDEDDDRGKASKFNCIDSAETNVLSGKLYTKVSGLINFDVVALKDDDTIQTEFAYDADRTVLVELVDGASNASLSPSISKTLTFSAADQGRKNIAFTNNIAHKNLKVKITDNTDSANAITAYSFDSFTVRPLYLSISSPMPIVQKAGDDASKIALNTNTVGYNQNLAVLTTSISKWLKIDGTDLGVTPNVGNGLALSGTSFDGASGNAVGAAFTFSDVGRFIVDLSDANWATGSGDMAGGDCRIDATNANVNSLVNNKYGCYVMLDPAAPIDLRFIPYGFKITNAALANSQTDFTYFSGTLSEQAATIPMTIEAIAKDGTTQTKNYAANLYERPITITPTGLTQNNYTLVNSNTNNALLGFENGSKILSATDAKVIKFNFDRSHSAPLEPLTINGNSATIRVVDSDEVEGNVVPNGSLSFLYGRIAMPSQMVDYAPSVTVKAYAQVYAASSSALPSGGNWVQAPGSSTWWINRLHESLTDNLEDDDVVIKSSSKLDSLTNLSGFTADVVVPQMIGGVGQINIGIPQNKDQKITLHFAVPEYLWYGSNSYDFALDSDCSKHPCATVDIFGNADSEWRGAGETKGDKTIKTAPKGKRAPKINW